MITEEKLRKVKLLAFDLDGTLLDDEKKLTEKVSAALLKANSLGYHVVISTGRELSTIPPDVIGFPGIRYAVTSNGARIYDLQENKCIYENILTQEAVDRCMPWIEDPEIMREIFFDGHVMADAHCLADLPAFGITDPVDIYYHTTTRKPCEDTIALIKQYGGRMENINLIFADNEKRLRYFEELKKVEGITVCSSLKFNIEIGGATTSKAEALGQLAAMLGLAQENIMGFGDSTNDLNMVAACGVGVAMGNAVDELKGIADWITLRNTEDGVAFALKSLLDI